MLTLSFQQRTLVNLLSQGKPVAWRAIDKALYEDRLDGGPTDPEGCIRSQIHYLRDRLAPYGIQILTMGWGCQAQGYMIDPEHQATLNHLLAQADATAIARARASQRHGFAAVNAPQTAS